MLFFPEKFRIRPLAPRTSSTRRLCGSGEGQPIGQHTFYAPNGGVPAIDQTEMPVDAADVSLSCSGQEAEKVPDEGLMTLADRG